MLLLVSGLGRTSASRDSTALMVTSPLYSPGGHSADTSTLSHSASASPRRSSTRAAGRASGTSASGTPCTMATCRARGAPQRPIPRPKARRHLQADVWA